ncbi:hypothetical protein JZ751_015655, partial [Albula glossodonta]
SYGAYPICKGCSVCSKDNGCLNCQPKLFLFLRREGMRQYGECLLACPSGYYGLRAPELNICSRPWPNPDHLSSITGRSSSRAVLRAGERRLPAAVAEAKQTPARGWLEAPRIPQPLAPIKALQPPCSLTAFPGSPGGCEALRHQALSYRKCYSIRVLATGNATASGSELKEVLQHQALRLVGRSVRASRQWAEAVLPMFKGKGRTLRRGMRRRGNDGCRIENCESCFSKDFCTKCKAGFYLHKGRCFEECPEGFAPSEDSMECGEGCEVGQWSEWGTCTRRNKTCGFKWGLETRTRQIVKKPPKDTIPCPTIAESRRCKMATRHCGKR